ncbi:MAG TPA: hypothetical protein VGO93_29285 [Candidatus Xenobia bacterium]|jgi:hypothetical protein
MQQAQGVVAQAQAAIAQLGNGNAPLGEAQAQAILSVIDGATGQLSGMQGGSDPALQQYLQSTLADLATARQDYSGMVQDIGTDDATDQQVVQQTDLQVSQGNQQTLQNEEGDDAKAVMSATVGTDEDTGDGDS